MSRQRVPRLAVIGLLVVALVGLGGSAVAATRTAGPGVQACKDVTSPGGAKVRFCWAYGEGTDFAGGRLPMWLVSGEVFGASFGQVQWVTADGRAVWQSTARPTFVEYFTWASERLRFRACNVNGCGAWVSA
ncbi:hypothetical protein [Actinokineospora sp. UTMC 2448]|uniref:hypothetical protein n=1 Tax=Actinokineospora sp. UTMC 2448 TaxID=2268449 RepID=UPI0021645BF4|nr:hypothetical protein [Actinokineospora sp. UTMC 2448]UVS79599.1 hypothetical protein Actkin_03349 [Actinokineospora sp. UTMC 2448]